MKNFLVRFLRLNEATVPLENKLSDIVTFGTFVSVGIGLIQNILIGIHWFVNSMLAATMLVSAICFYQSRFKDNYRSIRPFFLATIGTFLSISWFANYGVRGPSIILMNLFAVLGALLIKKERNTLFFIGLGILTTILLLIELYYPQSLHTYDSDFQWQMDLFNTYIFGIVFLALTISFFKSSYEEDREVLIETTDRLERSQEEMLKEKEKAEKAERAKTEFLANMSHEIRTPLNSIIGTADLLNETELSGRQQEYLETISISSRHLLNLVSDVLDMSRIDQGRLFLENQDFQLSVLLESTLKLFRNEPKISSKQLFLNLEIAPDTPEHLRGDAYRLRQVVVNLVSNAIKFSNTGNITIKASKKQAELLPGKIGIQFEVIDPGVGIQKEDLPKLFRPFSEIKTTTVHPFKGAGLGLAISRTIIQLMGGEISVSSSPGAGSTFAFFALFEAGLPPVQVPDTPEGVEGKMADIYPLSILVAEDNMLNQKLILRIMEHFGYQIDIVENGREALHKLNSQAYDLIFMDVQMPELDGIETTQALRQMPINQPYVVAMTAAAAPEDQEACFAAGMNDYVVKPISLTKIRALIPKWSEGVRKS